MTPAEPRSEPGRVPLAMGLIAALMVATLLFHLAALTQYGWFRDELYYAASTEHLAWGYVEHPPLSIALLALVRTVFGDSLAAIRLVPALAGAATVLVTALITRRLGGGRFAQGLAALTAVLAPVFLGTGRTYSMNALDLLLWALAALTLLRALDQGRVRDWTALGIVLGLGLLNKISILWFGAGLLAAFLVTPYRRLLLRPGPWIAGGAAFAMFVPHLAWQVRNGWPTLEFMRNATQLKMAEAPPGEFLARQILEMNPGAAPVWIAGLLFGLFARDRRLSVLAWIYLATLAILLTEGHGRASYLSVAYPMLLALGGVAFERFTLPAALRWIRPAIGLLVIVTGLIAVPMALPVLPVETFVRYQAALGFEPRTEERLEVGPLPQHYADMFGWDSMRRVTAVANTSLSTASALPA